MIINYAFVGLVLIQYKNLLQREAISPFPHWQYSLSPRYYFKTKCSSYYVVLATELLSQLCSYTAFFSSFFFKPHWKTQVQDPGLQHQRSTPLPASHLGDKSTLVKVGGSSLFCLNVNKYYCYDTRSCKCYKCLNTTIKV